MGKIFLTLVVILSNYILNKQQNLFNKDPKGTHLSVCIIEMEFA